MPNDCQNKPKLNQSDIEKLDFSGVEEMEKKNFEFLQKLGTPLEDKLDPIIKLWKEAGFEAIHRANHIIFRHHVTYKTIEICLINLSYKTYEWYDEKRLIADRLNIDEAQSITFGLHNLIHKTLMALGKEV